MNEKFSESHSVDYLLRKYTLDPKLWAIRFEDEAEKDLSRSGKSPDDFYNKIYYSGRNPEAYFSWNVYRETAQILRDMLIPTDQSESEAVAYDLLNRMRIDPQDFDVINKIQSKGDFGKFTTLFRKNGLDKLSQLSRYLALSKQIESVPIALAIGQIDVILEYWKDIPISNGQLKVLMRGEKIMCAGGNIQIPESANPLRAIDITYNPDSDEPPWISASSTLQLSPAQLHRQHINRESFALGLLKE